MVVVIVVLVVVVVEEEEVMVIAIVVVIVVVAAAVIILVFMYLFIRLVPDQIFVFTDFIDNRFREALNSSSLLRKCFYLLIL